jgi:hypothetical protein
MKLVEVVDSLARWLHIAALLKYVDMNAEYNTYAPTTKIISYLELAIFLLNSGVAYQVSFTQLPNTRIVVVEESLVSLETHE